MKLLILVLSVFIFLLSCEKDPLDSNEISKKSSLTAEEQKLIERLNEVVTYHKELNSGREMWFNWQQALHTAAADVIGAGAGAASGGKFGAIAGPKGAAAGAVVGGAIVGASASVGVNQDIIWDDSYWGIVDHYPDNPDYNPVLNPDNQYDDVGEHHNSIMRAICNGRKTIWDEHSEDLVIPEMWAVMHRYASDNIEFYEDYTGDDAYYVLYSIVMDEINNFDMQNSGPFLALLQEQDYINELLAQSMKLYFDGMSATTTENGFINYTLDFENAILDDGGISKEDKRSLSIAMTTARHSMGFWMFINNQFDNE